MDFSISGYRTYLACFVLGAVVSVSITPLVIRLADRLRIVDRPGGRKAHAGATPLMGGIGIFLGVWTPLCLLAFWSNSITQTLSESVDKFVAIFLAGIAMLALGIVDDKRGLNARVKFAVQGLVAVALVFSGITFGDLTVPFLGGIKLGLLGPILTVVWIVGITNALNLVDGIDGLATGIALFVAFTNAVVAIHNVNLLLALMMCAMAGACLGFLRYNFSPARIYLGDTGSLFIGVTLAATSVAANSKSTTAASMLIPFVALGYPVLDTVLAMARRSLLGKSMFAGDRGHIHHRLLAKGLSHRNAALLLYLVCALFSLTALAILFENDVLTAFTFAALFGLLFLGFRFLGFMEYLSFRGLRVKRPQFRIAHHFSEFTMAKLQVAKDRDAVMGLVLSCAKEFGGRLAFLQADPAANTSGEHVIFDARRSSAVMETQGLLKDTFRFDKVQFYLQVEFDPSEQANDLLLEHRLLFVRVAQAAADRLEVLQKQPLPDGQTQIRPPKPDGLEGARVDG